jgi:hypothetical protein
MYQKTLDKTRHSPLILELLSELTRNRGNLMIENAMLSQQLFVLNPR